ncbi:MAG: hypothetical protein ABI903_17265 [Actinomycetota bacterium]
MSGQLESAVVSDEIKSFVGAIQKLVAVEAERDAALDAVERLRAESADRIQVKVRLMAERDQALAEVERLKAENAGLRRGRITAKPSTWADRQVEP